MVQEFKVGDKVVCVSASLRSRHGFLFGEVVRVTETNVIGSTRCPYYVKFNASDYGDKYNRLQMRYNELRPATKLDKLLYG